jgi:pentatricopeptide repeat protein
MVKAALLAIATLVATPAISYACLNGTEWTTEDDVRMVQRAEKQFEDGRYGAALKTMKWLRPAKKQLRTRIADLKAIIEIRVHDARADLSKSVAHIEKRDADAEQKDIKLYAWRAEAYLAVGRRDEAKKILDDLHSRDLVPDAYGYLALAKLTTGTVRLDMWKACRTRAKDKDMCELPATEVSARKAPTK